MVTRTTDGPLASGLRADESRRVAPDGSWACGRATLTDGLTTRRA
jgi:hypothetical protein